MKTQTAGLSKHAGQRPAKSAGQHPTLPAELAELVEQARAAGASEAHAVRGCHKSLLFYVDPTQQMRGLFPLYDEVFLKHTSPVRLLLLVFPEELLNNR